MSFKDELHNHTIEQTDILRRAHFIFHRWKEVLCNSVDMKSLSSYDVYLICLKCQHLSKFYYLSIHFYEALSHVSDIAQLAIDLMNKDYKDVENIQNLVTRSNTILRWFHQYRDSEDCFNVTPKPSDDKLPCFLAQNPNIVQQIIE